MTTETRTLQVNVKLRPSERQHLAQLAEHFALSPAAILRLLLHHAQPTGQALLSFGMGDDHLGHGR